MLSLGLSLLQIDNLDPRGVQLAALFMSGVDMALFANDACGQPIPWEHCCPWMYFDGKLLQSKLIRANLEKAQLIDLCDGQVASYTPQEVGRARRFTGKAGCDSLAACCSLRSNQCKQKPDNVNAQQV